MKPCPPCKYSPMCLVIGFDKLVGEVIVEHLRHEAVSAVSDNTSDTAMAALLNLKAGEIVESFMVDVPENCPGKTENKKADVQIRKHVGADEVVVDVEIEVPYPAKRIGVKLKDDS